MRLLISILRKYKIYKYPNKHSHKKHMQYAYTAYTVKTGHNHIICHRTAYTICYMLYYYMLCIIYAQCLTKNTQLSRKDGFLINHYLCLSKIFSPQCLKRARTFTSRIRAWNTWTTGKDSRHFIQCHCRARDSKYAQCLYMKLRYFSWTDRNQTCKRSL